MAYVDPQSLDDNSLALVYIAGKTSEAKRVEQLFTRHGLSYTIKPTPFLRASLFGGLVELPGVGFYVPMEQAAAGRDVLQRHKFRIGLVLEGEE